MYAAQKAAQNALEAAQNAITADQNVDVAAENVYVAAQNVALATRNVVAPAKDVVFSSQKAVEAAQNALVAAQKAITADQNVDVAAENVYVAAQNAHVSARNDVASASQNAANLLNNPPQDVSKQWLSLDIGDKNVKVPISSCVAKAVISMLFTRPEVVCKVERKRVKSKFFWNVATAICQSCKMYPESFSDSEKEERRASLNADYRDLLVGSDFSTRQRWDFKKRETATKPQTKHLKTDPEDEGNNSVDKSPKQKGIYNSAWHALTNTTFIKISQISGDSKFPSKCP